nr:MULTISPECIES: hypothetical protein [Paraburkholderia]
MTIVFPLSVLIRTLPKMRRRLPVYYKTSAIAIRRAVCFNRPGQMRDRTLELQRHRACGMKLVVTAILLLAAHRVERLGRVRDDVKLLGR